MDFILKYLMVSADLLRMLFFIASGIIGFTMAWVFLREKISKMTKLHTSLKDSMDRLVDEYSNYKISIDKSLAEKDEAMLSLNQQLRHNQNMAEARFDKAYYTLQENVKKLTSENKNLKAASLKKKDAVKLIGNLKTKLQESEVKLKKKDALLMKAKSESFPREDSKEIVAFKKEIAKLNSKIDKLKKASKVKTPDTDSYNAINKKLKKKIKKLKALKNLNAKTEKIEYVETLDVKKLMDLIESGKLLKRRKSTVLSKNDRK